MADQQSSLVILFFCVLGFRPFRPRPPPDPAADGLQPAGGPQAANSEQAPAAAHQDADSKQQQQTTTTTGGGERAVPEEVQEQGDVRQSEASEGPQTNGEAPEGQKQQRRQSRRRRQRNSESSTSKVREIVVAGSGYRSPVCVIQNLDVDHIL